MIHTSLARRLALAFVATTVATAAASPIAAQDPGTTAQQTEQPALYTVEELDNLLAPVALYPDPILAQLLVAATFPDQIALAVRYVSTYGGTGIDDQAWDVSVKSVAHYAPVLNMLGERPNWATALGQAYAMQPGDVMASVQSLRRMARAQGNLVTTAEQRVEVEPQAIRIVPAQPMVIYVPTYDPEYIYYQPVQYSRFRSSYWSFGIGYPIGAWLSYDVDWGNRYVYYHGWDDYYGSSSWFTVSRPFIAFNSIYVGSRRSVVFIDRGVYRRRVDYDDFGRYNTVHRQVSWDRRGLPGRGYYGRAPKPDYNYRQGIPARRDAAVAKPMKSGRDDDNNSVPTVNRTRVADDGHRPPPTGDRGNRPGAPPGQDRRVVPTRIGGNSRPLYAPSEDLAPDRVKGTFAKRERDPDAGNGTWNPRAVPARDERTEKFARAEPRYTPSPRQEPYAAPRTRAREEFVPRAAAKPSWMPVDRAEPRSQPRSEPRSQSFGAPRAQPRAQPRAEPRAEPRRAERSVPSVSRPAKTEGRSGKARY